MADRPTHSLATPAAPKPTKETLLAGIAAARAEVQAHRLGLRRSASPMHRLKTSFHQHPGIYIGGAAVLGLLLSKLPASSKKKYRHLADEPAPKAAAKAKDKDTSVKPSHPVIAAMAATAVKMAFDLSKPILVRWLKDHALGGLIPPPYGNSGSNGGPPRYAPEAGTASDPVSPA